MLKIPVMYKFISRLLLSCLLFSFFVSCAGQQNDKIKPDHPTTKKIGGNCDGCEIMYVDMPDTINHTDTCAGWFENGQKLLVTGIVYERDGKTPAANILLYYWQTNAQGYYAASAGLNKNAEKHGHIRGWVKTNEKGEYAIYTIRPAPYPNDIFPAHIHMLVKEPGLSNEYYIDDLVFDEDPLLIPFKKKYPLENRGGSGVLRVLLQGDLQIAEHDIILGLNIPDYPENNEAVNSSGLPIGYDQPSFIPYHAYGPDKGSRACPVCKYGRYYGLLYFVGNQPDWIDIKQWLLFLETESRLRKEYLKVYFVYGNEIGYNEEKRRKELEKLGKDLELKQLALCFVPSFNDTASEINLNKINPSVKNTFIIYKNRRIIDKKINLTATEKNYEAIVKLLNSGNTALFNLKSLPHD